MVKKGMAFRTAYKIVGQIVGKCIKENKVLETLTIEEYKEFDSIFENDLYEEISLTTCVERRISEGGTSFISVEKQISAVKEELGL